MRKTLIAAACLATAIGVASPAMAGTKSRCMASVIKDVGAQESPESVMHKGMIWGPVTQLRVNKKTGATSYCAHGDYCYHSASLDIISPCRFFGEEDSSPTADDEIIVHAW